MRGLTVSRTVLAGVAALWVLGSTAASAEPTVIGSESTDGFVGPLFAGIGGYDVASDGESPFHPFGATFDVSDGISLDNPFQWFQADDSSWTPLGNSAWVLPADLSAFGCGSENEPTCEPVGHFLSSAPWVEGFTGSWAILDSEGNLSDLIITDNTFINDQQFAELWFYSDPSFPAPEPITLSLFGAGLAGVAALRRRKKNSA